MENQKMYIEKTLEFITEKGYTNYNVNFIQNCTQFLAELPEQQLRQYTLDVEKYRMAVQAVLDNQQHTLVSEHELESGEEDMIGIS